MVLFQAIRYSVPNVDPVLPENILREDLIINNSK